MKTIKFHIRRQDNPYSPPYWQQFEIPYRKGHNVVSALMVIREHPRTRNGTQVDPVAWEFNCMEEVCGACSMVINGRPRQACSSLVDNLEQPIRLEPLSKFPVIRDLMVDRSRMFSDLRKVRAWIEIDGAWDIHQGAPRLSPEAWKDNYLYSRCMSCGCCMEACPQYNQSQDFVGPASLAAVRLMNAHPTGKYHKTERLHAIMAEGGLSDCGNAQNCVQVCPKEIPLTTAIGELGRQVTLQMLQDLFGKSN
jgi:succinate dehydrogenase / fumarate reductase, iron-sulfur subunit